MNNFGRGNWFLMFAVLVVGMVVLVSAVVFNGHNVVYYLNEDVSYYHNLSANVSNFDSDITFAIDTDKDVNWTNSSGTFLVSASVISNWLSITDSVTGNLTINATYDNQTGFFIVPIQANNATGGDVIEDFEFQINATNDVPVILDLNTSYDFPQEDPESYTINVLDEEEHYPLDFNLTFLNNCTHASWSGRLPGENCSIFSLTGTTNTSTVLDFSPTSDDAGTYWAEFSVSDFNATCPHAYCDIATYEVNKTSDVYIVEFLVSPPLAANVSNCTGISLMEGDDLNCTITITTPTQEAPLTLSNDASFRNTASSPHDVGWFALDDYSPTSSNFTHNVSVFVANVHKREVGNWTINFTVDNGIDSPVSEEILVYVDYTESGVALDPINNVILYKNYSFDIDAVDKDLFILDVSVKSPLESLEFASNTSWVSFDSQIYPASSNYSTATFDVDWDTALLSGEGNYSVMINVTDVIGNIDNQTFIIEIVNETAPAWNDTLSDPVSIVLAEDTAFSYNVSVNVTDTDSLTFYYENISSEFCSLDAVNFNSTTGIISFTPEDCDVGYHNVTIIASDGKLNSSKSFNFTVNNVADGPTINDFNENGSAIGEGANYSIVANEETIFTLEIDDRDFLIPLGQRSLFYNESLTVAVVANNSVGSVVDLFNFSFAGVSGVFDSWMIYNVSFTPSLAHVENYTVFINITDFSGVSIGRTFYLNITESFNAPNLTEIANQSLTVHEILNFTVTATDLEDDFNGVNVSYDIFNLTADSPGLTIGNETGNVLFNMSSNESYSGLWGYNVTVTDFDGSVDWQEVYVYVYGNATLVLADSVFNLVESISTTLNFTVNHSVGDELVYEFWIDSITCAYQNNSNCTYGALTLNETIVSSGNATLYSWSFVPSYNDETYGNYKNLTLQVYPNSTELNSTQKVSVATNFSFSLNVSHTNHAPEIVLGFGTQLGTYGETTPIPLTLTNNFLDYDYLDSYYLQNMTFFVTSDEGVSSQIYSEGTLGANQLPWNGSVDSWSLDLYALTTLSELVTIVANDSFASVASNPFPVSFSAPSVVITPTPTPSRGGSTVKLKHFSLNLIAPRDIIISERGFIDIPFTIQNDGQVDLQGISLDTLVRFNDAFADDISISLADGYIQSLAIGQSENFSMRIVANTQRSGRYKATIFANVTSPKFSDFADFFIEIKKANESEAEQILIFTDKLVAENPECLELTEALREAKEVFSLGEYSRSLEIATEVVEACEDAIEANDQIRYNVEGFIQNNFYYISFSTLAIFFIGFVFYIYKRVRFNKSGVDEYV